MTAVIRAEQLRFRYPIPRSGRSSDDVWALKDLSFWIESGTSVGIIGETGSGKSTLVRVLCGLLHPESGSAEFHGRPVSQWLKSSPREFRRNNQLVFQSPASSFDPRMRIATSLAEPVKAIERRVPSQEEMSSWMQRVGLPLDLIPRYPHELSGGQLQRVAIARALSVQPTVLYADEPTSSLDVSVQAQVLNLLMDLQSQLDLTLVMVSHDLAVIRRICDYIIVMRHGELVEAAPTQELLSSPASDYTAKLIEAVRVISLGSDW